MRSFSKYFNKTNFFNKPLLVIGFLAAFFLPLYTTLTSVLLYVLACLILIYRFKKLSKKEYKFFYLCFSTTILFFLVPTIASIYSDSIYDTFKPLGNYLLYLLTPLSLLCLSVEERGLFLSIIKKGLICGTLTAALILLGNLSLSVFNNPVSFEIKTLLDYHHTYYNFTSILSKHPTYLGAEFFLAIVFLFFYLPSIHKTYIKILGAFSLLILSLCLVFLNSRAILTLFILFVLFILVRQSIKLFKVRRFLTLGLLLFSFIGTVFLAFTVISKTYVFHRYTHEMSWEFSKEAGTKVNSTITTDSRMSRWISALNLIKDKSLIGYGNNSEKRVLNKQFEKDGLIYAKEARYDAHNMYLSYLIEYGLWGFILFIIFILQGFYDTIKQRNIERFFLILMTAVVCLSDNYLKITEGLLISVLFINSLTLQKSNILKNKR